MDEAQSVPFAMGIILSVSIGQLDHTSRSRTRCALLVGSILACALVVASTSAVAQVATGSALSIRASEPAGADADVRAEVSAVRSALEHAEFEDAELHARALLQRGSLSARERNDTLELLAIAQVAARQDAPARATLSELFARDPEHPERLRDPGPNVETFFARVRAESRPSVAAALHVTAMRDARARVLIEVELGEGRDAVDSIHVFAQSPAPAEASQEVAVASAAIEPAHVVAEVGTRSRLTLALPPVSRWASVVELYVEARAPSGYVLGQSGSLASPLRVRLQPDRASAPKLQPTPLRRTWWLWTSVAIVAAGIGVTGALLAQ
ncbi:MAG: hypothetical protein JWN04_6434 [Myxococcaceae bacterium]|nr:hypothetical protein [Myxococcaceae bacterium]